jgi:hypothetical protein
MTDQTNSSPEIVDVVIDDVESGQQNPHNEVGEDDPNQKTCYTPILKQANDLYEQKIQPTILPIQEKVTPVMIKVGNFFDDDVDDPLAQDQTTDEDGNVIRNETTLFKVSPACFGAAVLGFGLTTVVIGPFIAVAAGAGAAYATSRPDTKAGEYSTFFGKKTYNGLCRGYKHSKKAMETLKGKFGNAAATDDNSTSNADASLEAA